jgi:hypothetical protein
MKHGGKRTGAGRKPNPDSKVVPRSMKVSRMVDEYLSAKGTGVIEDVLRRTSDFRQWLKSRSDR